MKRTLLLGLVAVALAAGIWWLLAENRRLRSELSAERAVAAARPNPASTTPAPSPAASTQAPAVAPPPSAGPARPPAPSAAARWADPQWRATQFNQAYLQAEVRHARFFQRLKHWPPERIEALKRQFAEQDLALQQRVMESADGGPPPDLARLHADQEDQLKSALTPEEYRDYQETEAMETSQQTVSSLLDTLRSRGVSLEPAQEEAVLRTYANTLREAATRAAGTSLDGLTPPQLAELKRQQLQALNEALLQRLSGVLTEAQLKSFMEAQLEQQGGG